MPYKIEKQGEKFCVVKESDGSTVHCHATEKDAQAQMVALMAAMEKEKMPMQGKSSAGVGNVASQRWNLNETLRRDGAAEVVGSDSDKRTVDLSFSSEMPVKRYDWMSDKEYLEVLSHDPADCDMSRLNNSHPLLLNHDTFQQIGVVERAAIGADRKGRATVRFSKSQLGEEIWNDVKSGIRRLVSVGYRRVKELASEKKDGMETVRFSWAPFEISIVPVPADPSVGIGRAETFKPEGKPQETKPMAEDNKSTVTETKPDPFRKKYEEVQAIRKSVAGKIPGSDELCDRCLADEKITIQGLRDDLFRAMPGVTPVSKPSLELPEKDIQRYSIARAIMELAEKHELTGLEREVSDEIGRITKQPAMGFYVPHGILARLDNIATTATLGGHLVATNLLAGEYIEILRNRTKVAALGARVLNGLQGNCVIPKQNSASVAYWATAETTATTQSTPDFGQITLTPKCVSGLNKYSKQLLTQSTPAIDSLLRDDLLKVLAIAIDKAALHTATGGPTPISATTGIATVTCGAAGVIPTYANIVAMETEVAIDNADVATMAYLTNARVRGALKTAVRSTFSGAYGFIWDNGAMNGYRAEVSNQVLSGQTVGTLTTVCSSIFFGDWSQLLIGTWGGTDIVVDPFSAAANREVLLYAHNFIDMAVRQPSAFSLISDALVA